MYLYNLNRHLEKCHIILSLVYFMNLVFAKHVNSQCTKLPHIRLKNLLFFLNIYKIINLVHSRLHPIYCSLYIYMWDDQTCPFQVTSKKDQEQYWADTSKQYRYITVPEFVNHFKKFRTGIELSRELSIPFEKSSGHEAALVFKKYSVPTKKLLKACFDKEWLLIKRNSFFYVFKTVQIIILALISSTMFLRTKMKRNNEGDGDVYVGSLLFAILINMFNGFAELSMTVMRLPVFYKQRDLLFHPAWTYTLPTVLFRIPISLFESVLWMVITYYTIGYAPEASRCFFVCACIMHVVSINQLVFFNL